MLQVSSMADQPVVLLRGFVPWVRDAVAILHNKSILLDLDRVITRVVPVVVSMTGDLRDDRQLLRPMAVAPDSIVVTGPERFVATID